MANVDKKDISLAKIESFSETITSVSCSKCATSSHCGGDEISSVEYFYKMGWRATDNNCYCPQCVIKFKIKK